MRKLFIAGGEDFWGISKGEVLSMKEFSARGSFWGKNFLWTRNLQGRGDSLGEGV